MFDPESPKEVSQLNEHIEWSNGKKKPFLKQDVELVKRLAGKHYGEEGCSENQPINFIELGASVHQRAVVATNTQAMVDSTQEKFLPGALDLELTLNQELRRMEFDKACNSVGFGALFRIGLMEVGITTDDTPPDGKGNLHDPGHVFADNVPFTASILDMRAKVWERMAYAGHDYTVLLEWVKENSRFLKKARDRINVPDGEPGSEDTDLHAISIGQSMARTEYEDTITLRQIYLYNERKVVTLVPSHPGLVLNVVDWEGPERGPYHRLDYGEVPGNLIPRGVIPFWADLNDIANRSFNKIADQIERQKTVLGVQGSADDDGNRIVRCNDGDAIKLDDPKACQEFRFGGADKDTLAAIMWIKGLWDYFGGNITALGGLGAMSRTVGQDQLIAGASSGRTDDMRDRMMAFKTNVLQDIGFWIWNDPVREYPIIKPVGSGQYGLSTRWAPENRMGRYFDYVISVNPFSEINRSPQEKAGEFIKFIVEVFPTLMPLFQAQGMSLDAEYIVKTISRYLNFPELGRAVIYTQGEQLSESGASKEMGMASNTTRRYVRENRPAATQQGQESAIMSQLLTGGSNGDQLASVMRNAG